MTENDCEICGEMYTNNRRKKIKCNFCSKECCLDCFKKYLLKSDNINPKCMFCSENISYIFIREICSYNFCNKELQEKRSETETKRQLSLLPNTQNLANLELEIRKYYLERKIYDDRINELKREIEIIKRQRDSIPWPTLESVNRRNGKITFIQKCPLENCKGFLDNKWKCGICETHICSKCLTPKLSRNDTEHVCDQTLVESITFIKKDSKPCPKCGTYIFKIEGCDQMWCPGCKTAFSWRTGQIETGTLHNPHYFEYMRNLNNGNLPRQPGDARPCEIVPCYNTIWMSLSRWNRQNNFVRDISREINNFVRFRNHFGRYDITRVNTNYQNKYTRLRVRYLLNDINLESLKKEIKKIIKKEEKDSQVLELYNLYYLVTGEILKNVNEMLNSNIEPEKILQELDKSSNIKKFCNRKLEIISELFKNQVKLI